MDVHEEPQTKRRRSLDIAHCVICSDLLQGSNQGPAVKNPTVEGLRSVLNAAELRQDDIYQQIWPHREDILTLQFKVSYHKSCRAQYTSKTNVSQTEKSESRRPVLLHPNQEDSPERILAASTSGNSASFADLPKNASQTKAGKSSHQSVQTLESPRDQK